MLVASFMRSAQGLTLYSLDGDTKNLNATDFDLPEVFVALKHLIETGDPVEIDYEGFRILKTLAAIVPEATIAEDAAGNVTIEYADLGLKIGNVQRLERFLREAAARPEKAAAMRAFLAHVAMSKREHSVDDLLSFMQTNDLPITPDGFVLAYKFVHKLAKLREDGALYVDSHSKTMDNSPGQLVHMRPEDVNPDRNQLCRSGLHACSAGYLSSFSTDSILVLKIHPAHFIAVPVDYRRQKARTCAHLNLGFMKPGEKTARLDYFLNVPAAPHPDGRSIVIGADVDPIYADLAAELRRRNTVQDAPETAVPASPMPAAPNKQRTRAKPAPFYVLKDLAEATARNVASLRALASRRGWAKRLGPSGFIEVRPDRDFIAAELTGWIELNELARQRHRTKRDIRNLARRSGWGMRTVRGITQIKPA